MVPFISPRFFGATYDRSAHGLGQLNVVYKEHPDADYLQGTFYTYTALLASEVIMDFPLPARGTVAASKYMLPGLSVVTFFYPSEPNPRNFIKLEPDGTLDVTYEVSPETGIAERRLMTLMRRCGFWSHPKLFRVSPRGAGIHYSGTLAMRGQDGQPYTTDLKGRVRPCRNVFVADAGVFPFLPAKNHTLTGHGQRHARRRSGLGIPGSRMKAIVTGAGGFIGAALVESLRRQGHEVIAVVRRPHSERPGVRAVTHQLGEPLDEADLAGVDLVVHLAHDLALGSHARNVAGTMRWFEQGRKAGVPLQVYVSSYSAHATAPSEYGRAKYSLETFARDADGIVVRPGLVLGRGGSFGAMTEMVRTLPMSRSRAAICVCS
jgi:hypothetical protein